jgi:hypothetical protein
MMDKPRFEGLRKSGPAIRKSTSRFIREPSPTALIAFNGNCSPSSAVIPVAIAVRRRCIATDVSPRVADRLVRPGDDQSKLFEISHSTRFAGPNRSGL